MLEVVGLDEGVVEGVLGLEADEAVGEDVRRILCFSKGNIFLKKDSVLEPSYENYDVSNLRQFFFFFFNFIL